MCILDLLGRIANFVSKNFFCHSWILFMFKLNVQLKSNASWLVSYTYYHFLFLFLYKIFYIVSFFISEIFVAPIISIASIMIENSSHSQNRTHSAFGSWWVNPWRAFSWCFSVSVSFELVVSWLYNCNEKEIIFLVSYSCQYKTTTNEYSVWYLKYEDSHLRLFRVKKMNSTKWRT